MYTQCPECSTVYRISSAELRAAQGEVQCGTCGASFNALASLSEGPPDDGVMPAAAPDLGRRADDEPPPSIQDTGEHRLLDLPDDMLAGPALEPDATGAGASEPVLAGWETAIDYQAEPGATDDDTTADTDAHPGERPSDIPETSAERTLLQPDQADADPGRTADSRADEDSPAAAEPAEDEADIGPATPVVAADTEAPGDDADTVPRAVQEPDHTDTPAEADAGDGAAHIEPEEQAVGEDRVPPAPAMYGAPADSHEAAATEQAASEAMASTAAESEREDGETGDAIEGRTDDRPIGLDEPDETDELDETDEPDETAAASAGRTVAAELTAMEALDDRAHTATASYTEDWAEALLREAESPSPEDEEEPRPQPPTQPDIEAASGEDSADLRDDGTPQPGVPEAPAPHAPDAPSGDPGTTSADSGTEHEHARTASLGQATVDAALHAAEETGIDSSTPPDVAASESDGALTDTDTLGAAATWPADPGELEPEIGTEAEFREETDLPEAAEGNIGLAEALPEAGMQKPATTGLPGWVDQFSEDEFEEIELPGTLDGRPLASGAATDPGLAAAAATDERPSVAPQATDRPASTADTKAEASDYPIGGSPGATPASAAQLPRELDPAASVSSNRWRVPAVIALLLTVVAAIAVHTQRAVLMRSPVWAPVLEAVYGVLGVQLVTRWDVSAFRILDSSASAGDTGDLTVNARFANDASFPQPFPTLRVTLQNRWGQALASQEFEPEAYLAAPAARRSMRPDEQTVAVVTLPSPGDEAVGFSVDLCLDRPDDGLRCLSESSGD